MEHLKEYDEYTIKFKRQELKDIWWFFNNYLNMNPESKGDNDVEFKTAKKFYEDFKFVVK